MGYLKYQPFYRLSPRKEMHIGDLRSGGQNLKSNDPRMSRFQENNA